MDSSLTISLISFFISFITILFTYLSFKRERRFENENEIFKLKIQVYNTFTIEIDKILLFYEDCLEKLNDHKKGLEILTEDELWKIGDDIDDEGDKLLMLFSRNQLLLSNETIAKIEKFCDDFIYQDPNLVVEITSLDKALDKMYEHADNLINELRKDLNIQSLNETLFKRINK